jgi:hypothetical protein
MQQNSSAGVLQKCIEEYNNVTKRLRSNTANASDKRVKITTVEQPPWPNRFTNIKNTEIEGIYESDFYYVVESPKIPEFLKTSNRFFYILSNIFATQPIENKLLLAIEKKLQTSSANAKYLRIFLILPSIKPFTQIAVDIPSITKETYFVKVQTERAADDLLLDNMVGCVLNKYIPSGKGISVFVGSFMIETKNDDNLIILPPGKGTPRQANIQKHIGKDYKSVTSVLSSINNQQSTINRRAC